MRSKPGPLRRFWKAARRRIPLLRPSDPPPDPPWPADEEADLVPVGPPRKPLPAAEIALELPTEPDPQVFPVETDAVGDSLENDDRDDESGRAAAL